MTQATLADPAAVATTRVAACGPAGEVRLEERPRPVPGPGELLLHLRRAGLCGTDLFKLAQETAALGSVLGHEVVGSVAAVGAGVRGFAAGDRVVVPHHVACGRCAYCRRGSEPSCPAFHDNQLSPGGFSEWIVVRRPAVERAACGLPDHLSDEAAVFLEPAACVLRGLKAARLAETAAPAGADGGCIAILGGGAMGLLHLLVARACHPRIAVVVSEPLPERRELALRLGAAAAADPGPATAQALAGLTSGRLADAVFDTAGGGAALDAALRLVRPGGSVVLFAHAGPGTAAGFELDSLFKSERRVIGTYSSSLADQREVFRLLCTRRLDPSLLVSHRLPLSRFAAGVALARERRALKVLFTPDGES
jgi:L-iditol 2-dehydrogenase